MNRFIASTAVAAVVSGLSLVAFAGPGHGHADSEAKPTVIVGELIDTACFMASDGEAKGADHASCAKDCLASGIPAGILPEGKGADAALFLLTNPKPFADHAAKTIRVEGVVHDNKAIDVKKAFVKDGEQWKEIQLDDFHHKMGQAEQKPQAEPKPAAGSDHGGHKH